MKKLSLILVIMMAISLFAGCAKKVEAPVQEAGAATETAATETTTEDTAATDTNQGKKAALLMPSTSNGFMAFLSEAFKGAFEGAGYEFELGIADGDSKKQMDQIENYITLKVDTLVVMAVDPSSLGDALNKAMENGIHVINFTTDPKVGDVFVGADEELVGEAVAELASEWIDKTFPNAADGSVEIAIMEFKDTPEASDRSLGLQYITELNKKVTVKTVQVMNTTKDAQTASENLFLTNPNIKCVLTYNSSMALGVNAYAMTPGSAIKEKATFATFGADQDAEVLSNIQASVNNESIVRGATQIGGDINEVIANVVKYSDQLIAGEETIERDIAPINKITPDNVAELLTQQ